MLEMATALSQSWLQSRINELGNKELRDMEHRRNASKVEVPFHKHEHSGTRCQVPWYQVSGAVRHQVPGCGTGCQVPGTGTSQVNDQVKAKSELGQAREGLTSP
jgi:hypothetical protein